ncbi:MAG: hypothetical protein RLY85_219 [Bacteroidota bacterium]
MKKRIKQYLFRLFYRHFLRSLAIYEDEVQNKQLAYFQRNAIIGNETQLFDGASIFNNLNDRSKIRIGNNCSIKGQLLLFAHGGEIVIGDYCYINQQAKLWSAKKITIGNRVLIAHGVNIHDNISHPKDSASRHKDIVHIQTIGLQKENFLHEKEIIIKDDVWIGFNATIMKGVTIGKGAIIGANTMVLKDVPDFAVCVGNPMRIIEYTT